MANEPPPPRRRLARGHDRKLGGVAGGLAEYFDIDPTLVRVMWIVALFVPPVGLGAAVVAYVVMWFVMPEPEGDAPPRPASGGGGPDASLLLGIVIVALGLMLLLRQTWFWAPFWGWAGFNLFWPAILVLLGAFIIYSARRRN